jgi:hypothetical protein
VVVPGSIIDSFTPNARVATALAPFAVALMSRIILGRGNLTRWLITLSTMWFAINVLMAPYSAGMRQDLVDLQQMLR